MSNDVFDVKILAEKLSKLNNSQQSIESLSRWCISHRKKARHIVETWEKMLNSSQKERCVSFLYLANDILQNSRRKGSEFVNEFWKVLPGALKQVYDHGDEGGKKAATRLVDIWEERKVFGSRVQSLKDEIMALQGKDPVSQVVSNGKSANPIKIMKKDAQSLRIKLAVGECPEKIVSAFHCLHDECGNEESALSKCDAAILSSENLMKEVESTVGQGIQLGSAIADEMQEQEDVLEQCVKQLEGAEATRATLVGVLKEALHDQEAKLENIRHQLLIARCRINELEMLKPKVSSDNSHGVSQPTMPMASLQIPPPSQPPPPPPPHPPTSQPTTSFASLTAPTTDEESKKAAAAAVAAKLAASTSSAQMLTSILSSLVAEEAAASMAPPGFPPMFSPDNKRQKLEHPSSGGDPESGGGPSHFTAPLWQPVSQGTTTTQSQASSMGGPSPPPLPPPGLMPHGMVLNMMPFGMGNNGLPPPPPLPMGLARPPMPQGGPQPPPLQPPQQLPQQQQNAIGGGGYYRPPGIGLYGASSQPSTAPVNRQ